jgi:hypothetical protein
LVDLCGCVVMLLCILLFDKLVHFSNLLLVLWVCYICVVLC